MFKENLGKIVQRKDLTEAQMAQMITDIFSGNVTEAQIGALMAALATKGETFEELAGAARAMRRKALRIQAPSATVVDTCGTGGDGAQTFNISTTTAFVVAGCGVTVAKHGNRSVSSRCGSADLLETLGVKLDTHPEIVEEAVREIGIGFLFAPLYHGAMKYAAKARKEVGLRSIFNMLGPLTNPGGANCQLLGVYAPELTEMFANALQLLGEEELLWSMAMTDSMRLPFVPPPVFQSSKKVLSERTIFFPNNFSVNRRTPKIFWEEILKKMPKSPEIFWPEKPGHNGMWSSLTRLRHWWPQGRQMT